MPPGWHAKAGARLPEGGVIRLSSSGGAAGELVVWPKAQLAPSAVAALNPPTSPTVIFARWISPRTQELLRARGIGFLDTTGNVEVLLDSPAFYISAQGAVRDPQPKPAQRPSLRGPRVWALLRTIVEVEPPYGVRELASNLGLTAGYVSRVLKVLEQEALIGREPRGAVATRDWEPLLRTLTRTYSVLDANTATTWIATAGPEQFLTDIAGKKTARFVVTGSFGASRLAPVAAPTVAMLYTDDPERLARTGRLLPAEQGANVTLLEPYDPVVFQRTWSSRAMPYASIAQIAADCLTGAGRMPAEGEALIEWMRRNPQRWSAPSLRTTVAPIAA
jgi:hypothetical protein